jgi:hypothetical protein
MANHSHPGITLKNVSPVQVFNLPLYEHHLVLDARPKESFEKGTIVSSVSFPAPPVDTTEKERELCLVAFIIKLVGECSSPDNASPVVIYGENTEAYRTHVSWLSGRLSKLKHSKLTIAMISGDLNLEPTDDATFDPLEYFCNTIASRTTELWNIEGGFESFQAKYSYLCGTESFGDMLPIPYEITPNIYLGSRAMVFDKDTMTRLGITHFVGANQDRKVDWDGLLGVTTLKCAVQDVNYQQMTECWEAVTMFISEALKYNSEAKVLIYLWGRSRSSSAIMAYLIRAQRYSLDDAQAYVRGICSKIDPSLIYYDQLVDWSEQRFLLN